MKNDERTHAQHDEQDEAESPRQQARRARREAGDRSARASHTLMQLRESEVARLELDDDLRTAVERARAIIPHVARRRAERRLAGDLRNVDLDDLEARLENLKDQGQADVRMFQRAEAWRARLLEEAAAVEAFHAEYPGLDHKRWHQLINSAQRERDRGKPRGAKRELFREVMAVLRGK